MVRPSVSEETIAAVDAVLDELSDVDPARIGFEHKVQILVEKVVQKEVESQRGAPHWVEEAPELSEYY